MIGPLRRRFTSRWQRRVSRLMQVVLVLLLGVGLIEPNPKVIINAAIALFITFSPAILKRNYRLTLDPWLALWVTTAVFLHTLGSAGFYGYVGWWDHLTHALSATLIAGIGYITVRAVDLHHREIRLPRRYMFVYAVVFVMAFGVVWELFEFGLDVIAIETGLEMPLAQHGVDDTIRDMMFNTLGAIVVATAAHVHLSTTAEHLRQVLFGELG